jgi:hypothetical protein
MPIANKVVRKEPDKYPIVMVGTNLYFIPDHLMGKIPTVKVYAVILKTCPFPQQILLDHQT